MTFILTKRVQELESDRYAQQREQESVLAAICKSLKDEHQAELRKSQRQMTQVQEKFRKQSSAGKQRHVVVHDVVSGPRTARGWCCSSSRQPSEQRKKLTDSERC